MTGNILILAFATARVSGLSVARSSTALIAFATGAILGGRITARASADSRIRFAAQAFLLEVVFLSAASFGSIGYRSDLLEYSFQPCDIAVKAPQQTIQDEPKNVTRFRLSTECLLAMIANTESFAGRARKRAHRRRFPRGVYKIACSWRMEAQTISREFRRSIIQRLYWRDPERQDTNYCVSQPARNKH